MRFGSMSPSSLGHGEDATFPEGRSKLEYALGCKFVFHNRERVDVDGHSFSKPWRNASQCHLLRGCLEQKTLLA